MAIFSMQQTGQLQMRSIYDARISMLRALKSLAEDIQQAETQRNGPLAKFNTAVANISDYLHSKQPIEDYLQYVVIVIFSIGCSPGSGGQWKWWQEGGSSGNLEKWH